MFNLNLKNKILFNSIIISVFGITALSYNGCGGAEDKGTIPECVNNDECHGGRVCVDEKCVYPGEVPDAYTSSGADDQASVAGCFTPSTSIDGGYVLSDTTKCKDMYSCTIDCYNNCGNGEKWKGSLEKYCPDCLSGTEPEIQQLQHLFDCIEEACGYYFPANLDSCPNKSTAGNAEESACGKKLFDCVL